MLRRMHLLLLCVAILIPSTSWGWGCVGHQVVAYIASQNLNAAAAAKVADLLSDAEYGDFQRFCAPTKLGNMEFFATWADDARNDSNAGWHFWDIPLAIHSASMPSYCDEGCVVSALQEQAHILQDPKSSRPDQQHALMFLIHFVGDAHQPMHIVDNGDRGGNCVPVSFKFTGQSATTREGKDKDGNPTGSYTPNLHSIWDTNIIATMTGKEDATNRDQLTKAFARKVASRYSQQIKSLSRKKVDFDTDFQVWALATHWLAQPNSYGRMPTAIPVDPHPATLKSCKGVSSEFVGLHETAQGAFITNAQSVIKQQLALGGARLAATLNAVWPN
jgi:nuclease S1